MKKTQLFDFGLFLCLALPFLFGCSKSIHDQTYHSTNNNSDYSDFGSIEASKEETIESQDNTSLSNYSDHVDGEAIVYSYSCISYEEFFAFFTDFSISNFASFITFNFDNCDGITSEFVFEGYPVSADINRQKVATTSFKYFNFSFSFFSIDRNVIGEDNSCLISIEKAMIVDIDSVDHSNLVYSLEKQNANAWKVSLLFDGKSISSLKIKFNNQQNENVVTEYCKLLIDNIVLLKGDKNV